jgi:hypothetical protein
VAGFARIQRGTWSPPGWFDDAEFAATAESFANPDWVPITLYAYRSCFLAGQERDRRYEYLLLEPGETEKVSRPTVWCIQAPITVTSPAAWPVPRRPLVGSMRRGWR